MGTFVDRNIQYRKSIECCYSREVTSRAKSNQYFTEGFKLMSPVVSEYTYAINITQNVDDLNSIFQEQ